MGVATYGILGGLEGFGRGLAAVGEQEARTQAFADREALRQADRLELLQERLENQRLRSSGGGSKSPSLSMQDLLALPDDKLQQLYVMGGMAPTQAGDAVQQVRRGGVLQDVALTPERFTNPDRQVEAAQGPQSVQVQKYAEGQAADLSMQSFRALRRAVGLGDPKDADNIAKAEGTEQTTGLVKRFVDSGSRDVSAGEGVLLSHGKGVRSAEGTSEITGTFPKGSVAEATAEGKRAEAAKDRADAGNPSRKEGVEELRILLLSIENQISEARKRRTELSKDLSPDSKTAIKAEDAKINSLQTEHETLRAKIRALSERKAGGKGGGDIEEAPRDPAKRIKDRRYNTPKGVMKWMGNGWLPG
jgi:hypothetical protein